MECNAIGSIRRKELPNGSAAFEALCNGNATREVWFEFVVLRESISAFDELHVTVVRVP